MHLNKFLTVAILSLASTYAVAGPACHEPKSTWLSAEVFQSQLKEQGYKIKKFKVTSGDCYEIYGWNPQGERVEVYFNPATGQAIKTKRG